MAAGRSKNAGTFKLFSHVVGTLLQIPPQISSLSYDGNEDWIEKNNLKLQQNYLSYLSGSERKGERGIHYLNWRQVCNVVETMIGLEKY